VSYSCYFCTLIDNLCFFRVNACRMFKQYRADATALAADEYELQYSGKVNDIIPVCKYRSRKTGLRVVVAEVQGPLVNGYFCLGMC